MFKLYRLKNYNFRLIIWLLMISGIGVLLVGSAKASLQSRQLIGVILGLVVMVVVSLMDYSWLLNFYWIIYGVNIIMLLIVRFFGDSAGGATRWLDLGFVRFQPTELSKILLIMFFARFLMDHEDTLNTCKTILASVVLLAVPLVLIKIQPDLKNTITVTIIFCLMMYVAGLSYKIIGGILGVAIPLVIVAFILITQTDIKIIDSYQKDRIMSWMYPEDETYKDDVIQQQNSITAIGSGELTGKGYNNNKVSSANKGNFVTQIQTDFIFAVAGEELGFIGSVFIILLLFLIVVECIITSRKHQRHGRHAGLRRRHPHRRRSGRGCGGVRRGPAAGTARPCTHAGSGHCAHRFQRAGRKAHPAPLGQGVWTHRRFCGH